MEPATCPSRMHGYQSLTCRNLASGTVENYYANRSGEKRSNVQCIADYSLLRCVFSIYIYMYMAIWWKIGDSWRATECVRSKVIIMWYLVTGAGAFVSNWTFFKQLLVLIWIFCMFLHIECIRRIFVFVTFSLFYKTLLNNGKDLSGNKNSKIKIRLSK